MSESNPDRYVSVEPTDITFLADGSAGVSSRVEYRGVTQEQAIDAAAMALGVDPESVSISGVGRATEQARGNSTAAFSAANWRSSWQPTGGNPNLN